ncbi:hypothetical protein Tco_0833974 [Tanacetum coccineum]
MVAVMSNGPSKQLCIERFPQLASVSHITEPSHNSEPASSDATEHVYASLYRALTVIPRDLIALALLSGQVKEGRSESPKLCDYHLKDKVSFFQMHFPVYSSRFVRFRMGHPKSWIEMDQNFMRTQECADYKFVWTYTSEMFPVAQVAIDDQDTGEICAMLKFCANAART